MKLNWQTAGVIFSLILVLSTADCLYKGLTGDDHVFRVLAGGEVPVSGKLDLPYKAAAIKDHSDASAGIIPLNDYLSFDSPSKGVHVTFLAMKGRLWRGVLQVSEGTRPGIKTFRVFLESLGPGEDTPQYTARIFRDADALKADLESFSERILGVQPWWTFVLSLPLVILCMYRVFKATGEEEDMLIGQGIGPIYKLARRKQSWEIVFGLGFNQGVGEGDRLCLLDRDLNPSGHLYALKVGPDTSHATVEREIPVCHDWMVALESSLDTDSGESHTATREHESPSQ